MIKKEFITAKNKGFSCLTTYFITSYKPKLFTNIILNVHIENFKKWQCSSESM